MKKKLFRHTTNPLTTSFLFLLLSLLLSASSCNQNVLNIDECVSRDTIVGGWEFTPEVEWFERINDGPECNPTPSTFAEFALGLQWDYELVGREPGPGNVFWLVDDVRLHGPEGQNWSLLEKLRARGVKAVSGGRANVIKGESKEGLLWR